MQRNEYEKRVSDAAAFQRLYSMPEWKLVDDLLVQMSEDTSKKALLDIPREKLGVVYDMLNGRQECILLIRDAMMGWVQDLNLRPELIDPEPNEVPDLPQPAGEKP